jgi:DNA-binding transcriptional regulator YiaG
MCNEATGIHVLESVRTKKGLSIVAFTNLLPVQRSTYYSWLGGKRKPDSFRMQACLKIAEKLK